MKNLFIILILFMACSSAFGSNENPTKDEIWCSYEKNDTRYHGLEKLKKQCEYGLTQTIFLTEHGYSYDYIGKKFPYFSDFIYRCLVFLDSIYEDENGKEVAKYRNKACSSVQAILHAGTEFDLKIKQEGLMTASKIEKIKEKK